MSDQRGEILGEDGTRPLRERIRERQAPRQDDAEVMEPRRMAGKAGLNLAQALCPGQLGVELGLEKSDKLALRRQPVGPRIRTMSRHKPSISAHGTRFSRS